MLSNFEALHQVELPSKVEWLRNVPGLECLWWNQQGIFSHICAIHSKDVSHALLAIHTEPRTGPATHIENALNAETLNGQRNDSTSRANCALMYVSKKIFVVCVSGPLGKGVRAGVARSRGHVQKLIGQEVSTNYSGFPSAMYRNKQDCRPNCGVDLVVDRTDVVAWPMRKRRSPRCSAPSLAAPRICTIGPEPST